MRITPEMVELFRLCLKISDEGLDDIPEIEGGRGQEYYEAQLAFHTLIKWKPWEFSPIWITGGDGPPAYVIRDGKFRIAEWKNAATLRRKLEQAAVRVTLG
jgi:hypothetical protein